MSHAAIARQQSEFAQQDGALRRVGQWASAGWRLFRRAPVRLFGVMIAMLVLEGIIQATVPGFGLILSKWVLAMAGGIVWIALANLEHTGKLHPLKSMARCRDKILALMLLAMVSLSAFAMQLGVTWLLAGAPGVEMLLFGAPAPIDKLELAMILAAGIPVSTLLMFTAPRLLLDRETLPQALVRGVRAVLRRPGPMGILLIMVTLPVALAPVTLLLSFLITSPWLLCVAYAAYRDIGRAGSANRDRLQ